MEDDERDELVARWWEHITVDEGSAIELEQVRGVLGDLVGELAVALVAEPFDAAVGLRLGAALAAAGMFETSAPTAAVHPMRRLAADSGVPNADRRVAALLAAVVRGHREKCTDPSTVVDTGPHSITEQAFRAALDNAVVAVAIGDLDGTVRYANPALADLLGVPLESIHTLSVFDFTHPDDLDLANVEFLDKIGQRAGVARLECRMVRTDGEVRWASVAVTYIPGSGSHRDTFVALAEDITQRRRLQEELHWQARHDSLTGLSNRRGLQEQIDSLVTTARPDARIGLCFADIDQFKDINDRYGHTAGDTVLAAVAQRLQESVVGWDYVVTRIGGDEFVVLIAPPADENRVVAVADALLASLTTPIEVGEHTLLVSVSIGVVVAEVSGQDATELLDAADRALYRAKSTGKHRWVLHDRSSASEG